MPAVHRAAAWLRHVADEEPAPAYLGRLIGETFEEPHQVWMPPIAVARLAHHLPGLAVEGQRFRAGEATPGIKADGTRRERCRRRLAAKQFLGRRRWIVGICQRRQRV